MNKANVIVVHGAYGHSNENWFAWLREQLMMENITCYIPELPTPQGQTLSNWTKQFDQYVAPLIHDNTILIGHSLGAIFILRWLQQCAVYLPAVILVGAFWGKIGIEAFDTINHSFFATSMDFAAVRKKAKRYISYYGENDPYLTEDTFYALANHLAAEKIIVANAGHFNLLSDYTQFPHLLHQLQNIIPYL